MEKTKKPKFTFKTTHPTGRYASFYSDHHYIKLSGKVVGEITPIVRGISINKTRPFSIRLMVYKDDIMEDGNPNCTWKWITLKKENESLEEAKEFLNQNAEAIVLRYKLHSLDE